MTTTADIEVRDMAIVHRTFRATYAEAAGLVRGSEHATGDRVRFLADHIDFALAMLHGHHESEDLILWPLLLERAPDEAEMVKRVAHQHEAVAAGVERVGLANAAWRTTPDAATRDELAVSLDELGDVLQAHLDDEEQHVVPLAARTLTQDEWNSIGAHSRGSIPRDKTFIAFGSILEPLSDADRAYMLSEVPGPVKLLWRTVGQRSYGKYVANLRHGS